MFTTVALAAAISIADPPNPLTADERKGMFKKWNEVMALSRVAYKGKNYTAMESALREALRIARRLAWQTPSEDEFLRLSDGYANVAFVLQLQGRLPDAVPYRYAALAVVREMANGKDNVDVANVLYHLARLLADLGRLAEAEPLYREALGLYQRSNPNKPDQALANTLNSLGSVLTELGALSEGESHINAALAMWRELYQNKDHHAVVNSLGNLGTVLKSRGRVAEAEAAHREALEMARRLFRDADDPDLITALINMAIAVGFRSKMTEAEELLGEAVTRCRRLYPGGDHADLAQSLISLAAVRCQLRKYAEAEELCREGLKIYREMYVGRDHPLLATAIGNLASVVQERGDVAGAAELSREALEMTRRLHSGRDHPDLARCVNNHAEVLFIQGKSNDALALHQEALAMFRQIHEGRDHPHLLNSIENVAYLLGTVGRGDDARPLYREAIAMSRRLTVETAHRTTEGDALSFAAARNVTRDCYLSNAIETGRPPSELYAEVWSDKGQVSRVIEQRFLRARAVEAADVGTLFAELTTARIRRAELLLARTSLDPEASKRRAAELDAAVNTIRRKEKAIRSLLPAVPRAERLGSATTATLQQALVEGVAVVDFLKWGHFRYDATKPGREGVKRVEEYLAFVVTKAGVKMVDLGPADAIEKAVGLWREAIQNSRFEVPADLGAEVRKLVWEKVRKELPIGVKEVFISPDAALCRLPWVALPGDRPGTVLLEDEFAVATIPHAPFLLDHLWEKDKSIKEKAGVLVVGGVDFDAKLGAKVDPKAKAVDLLRDAKAKPWPTLPASASEAEALVKLAGERKWATTALTGDQATAAAVLAALPKAKHAHLATHGFFADAKFRSAFQLDEKDYQISHRGERVGRAANSPLVMTGLVLAGANDPATPGRGVVTGESLIDLDLSGLELAVLSACDTGLGDVAGGEGTFGLQRAFHLAGTRNVVAGLWSVPDAATAALMGEFYRHLWEKQQSPMQALKAAQLAVYRAERAKLEGLQLRGFKDSGVKAVDPMAYPPNKATDGTVRNHPALWAAFSLSGPGR